MSSLGERPHGETLQFVAGLVITLLFHGALVGAYLYWYLGAEEAVAEPEPERLTFVATELLMYGEVMPAPNELPSLPNPEPEERPEEVVRVEPQEEQVVVEQEPPPPEDVPVNREEEEEEEERPRDTSRHNPNRPTNRDPLIGSHEGFAGGTSLSPEALANLWGRTQQAIQREFRPPPGVTGEEIGRLYGRVRIYFNRDGRILRYSWVERSGNRQFDTQVERAINVFRLGSQRLPLPTNERALGQAIDDGVIIRIEP